jgi:hypothetical protein
MPEDYAFDEVTLQIPAQSHINGLIISAEPHRPY